MGIVFWAIGLVLIVEGLVLALAPLRIEDALRMLAKLDRDQKRVIGLIAAGLGVALIWLARLVGG